MYKKETEYIQKFIYDMIQTPAPICEEIVKKFIQITGKKNNFTEPCAGHGKFLIAF